MQDPAAIVFGSDRTRHGRPERLSRTPQGQAGDRTSESPDLSADGSVAVFTSGARDLVEGEVSAASDVYVSDGGHLSRITQGNEISRQPGVSGDGRVVAFASRASDLVEGDTNHAEDVFVHDRTAGATTCVSRGPAGQPADNASTNPAVSGDGRWIAFESQATNLVEGDTNGRSDVFLHDRASGTTRRVSVSSTGEQANAASSSPSISADGRFVAFASDASNLVPNDRNGFGDVFVHDLATGETTCVSRAATGGTGNLGSGDPVISADGRFVAFQSYATNLEHDAPGLGHDDIRPGHVFVHDRQQGTTVDLTPGFQKHAYSVDISADGRCVVFTTNQAGIVSDERTQDAQVYVRDLETNRVSLVSTPDGSALADGQSYAGAISADGRRIAFTSYATNLDDQKPRSAQVYVVDSPVAVPLADRLAPEAPPRDTPEVVRADDYVIVDGIRLPRNKQPHG